jgi:hypothetical protein
MTASTFDLLAQVALVLIAAFVGLLACTYFTVSFIRWREWRRRSKASRAFVESVLKNVAQRSAHCDHDKSIAQRVKGLNGRGPSQN